MKILYTAEATAYGGRVGRVTSDDDRLDVELSAPADMGGPGGDGTNPEQLFAAGYAACFHSALQLVARKMQIDATDSTVTAKVGIGKAEDRLGYGLEVALEVSVPNAEREQAQQLVDVSHQVCPYSNATRGNIPVELTLV